MKIGILALQGAVAEHLRMIESLGYQSIAVKKAEQLADIDGLIIPGGESTTIGKLIKLYEFQDEIINFYKQQKPIFGTCAGLILLANKINGVDFNHLGILDVKVERNAFGRQRDSFEAEVDVKGIADKFKAVFIRAPYVMEVYDDTQVLATYDNKIVVVRQKNVLASAFHPELTEDARLHKYFTEMVEEYSKAKS